MKRARQRQADTIWFHLHMGYKEKRVKLVKTENKMMMIITSGNLGEMGSCRAKGTSLQF